MDIITEIESFAAAMETDVETMWEAFRLFCKKEIALVEAEPANDAAPVVETVAPSTETPA